MPFLPMKKHHVENGQCTECGMDVPVKVRNADGTVYSHVYVNGDPVFLHKPEGRYVPCHTEKPL
jgi:hypothetical protein